MVDQDTLIERRIDATQRRLDNVKVLYQRFLTGNLALPPEDEVEQIRSDLRHLRAAKLRRSVDRFRVANLEAQFSSYNEMFNRQVRNIEEGRQPGRSAVAAGPSHDPDEGIVFQGRPEGEALDALFQGLCERSGSSKLDLDTFRTYIGKQMSQIQRKTGCDSVQFRLVSEDGKVKIKAKPLGSTGGS